MDLGFYSEEDAKPVKGVSREMTQSDLLSKRFLTVLRIDLGTRIGRGSHLGSCWNNLSRDCFLRTELSSAGV